METLGKCRRPIATCCLVIASVVGADPITWVGEDEPTAFFDLGGNWEPSGAPGSDDTAIVPEDAVVSPILRSSQTISALQAPGGLRLNAILTVEQPSSVSGLVPWGTGTKRVRTVQSFTFGGDNNLKPIVLEGQGILELGRFIHDGGTTIGSASMTAPFVNRGGILKLDGAPSFTELTNDDRLELTRTRVAQGLIENTASVTYAHDPGLTGGGSLDDFKQTAGVLKVSSGELEITGDIQHYDGGEIEVADGADLRIVGSALNGPSSSDQRFGGLRVARGDGTLEVSGMFQVTQDVEMSLSGDGVDSQGLIMGGLEFSDGATLTNLGGAHFDSHTRLTGLGTFVNDSGGMLRIAAGDLNAPVDNLNGGLVEVVGSFYVGDLGVFNQAGGDWFFRQAGDVGAVVGSTGAVLGNAGNLTVELADSNSQTRFSVPLNQTGGVTTVKQGTLALQNGGNLAGKVLVSNQEGLPLASRMVLAEGQFDIQPGFESTCQISSSSGSAWAGTFDIGTTTTTPEVRVLSDWTLRANGHTEGEGYHRLINGRLKLINDALMVNEGRLVLLGGSLENLSGQGGLINENLLELRAARVEGPILSTGTARFFGTTSVDGAGRFINQGLAVFFGGADLLWQGGDGTGEPPRLENEGRLFIGDGIESSLGETSIGVTFSNKGGLVRVYPGHELRLADVAELDAGGVLRDGGTYSALVVARLTFPRDIIALDGSTLILANQSDQLANLNSVRGKRDALARLLLDGEQRLNGRLGVREFGELGGSGTIEGPGVEVTDGKLSGTLTLDTDKVDTDGATIAPGNSTGMLVVTGDLNSVNTVFEMELVDATSEDYDRIDIGGDMTLNGDTIQLSVLDDAEIDEGDAFDLFRAQSITGAETVNLAVPPGLVVSREVVAQGGREVLRLTIADIGPEFEPRRRQNASILSIINLLLDDE